MMTAYQLDQTIADGPAIAACLHADYGLQLPQSTIRSWARRGVITRHGRDRAGRTLYDLDEILTAAGVAA